MNEPGNTNQKRNDNIRQYAGKPSATQQK